MGPNHFFSLDSPLIKILDRVGKLIILNLLFLLCSLPVVTAGAAFTALHFVCQRMVRDEEGYTIRDFFRSFRMNFRQSTVIWLFILLILLLVGADIALIPRTEVTYPTFVHLILRADAVIVLVIGLFAFPLQARFENTLGATLKNAIILAIGAFPRTLAMFAVMALPFVIAWGIRPLIPIVMILGFSSAVYACAALYAPVFRRLEPLPEMEEENEAPAADPRPEPEASAAELPPFEPQAAGPQIQDEDSN